jgi:hypothetical protein|tara:strand:+ start:329 stop:613 length:285 start_codon:yes stop_codon:yes gene_type:complete
MKVRLIKLNSGETIISQIHLWGGKNDDMELLNPLMVIEDPRFYSSNFELGSMSTLIDVKKTIHIKHQNIVYTATPKEKYIQKYIQTVSKGELNQ